jgi:hypothetical protein
VHRSVACGVGVGKHLSVQEKPFHRQIVSWGPRVPEAAQGPTTGDLSAASYLVSPLQGAGMAFYGAGTSASHRIFCRFHPISLRRILTMILLDKIA